MLDRIVLGDAKRDIMRWMHVQPWVGPNVLTMDTDIRSC